MRRITQTLIAIFLWCAFMLGACSRQTTDQTPEQYQINQLQEWLQRNGGIFRQGTITVKNPDDHLVTGQLAWQQRKEIAYNGERFIQIPFIFGGSRASLPGNEKIAPVRFDLIMQVEAGIPVKAAVRTTMIGATVDRSNGRKEKGYLQAYHWLSGAPAYAWLTTLDLTQSKRLYKHNIASKGTVSVNGSSPVGVQQLMCETYLSTVYETVCWYATPQDQQALNATCTSIPSSTIYVDCYNIDEPGTPGGGTGGGGSGGNGGTGPVETPFPPIDITDNLAPGDRLCPSTFQFLGGSQQSYWLTNVLGIRFENSSSQINTLPSTLYSLTNSITNTAMNTVPALDYLGKGKTPLQYLQDGFPQLFSSGDIHSAIQGGQTVWQFSHSAAQAISAKVSDLVAFEIVMLIGDGASVPGYTMIWDMYWEHCNKLIKTLMPGSTIGKGYSPSGGLSNAIYSGACNVE